MTGLKALFIWIGMPIILKSYFELEGVLWTFVLGGVFGLIAFGYYGYFSAKDDGIELGPVKGSLADNRNNLNVINGINDLISGSNFLINTHTDLEISSNEHVAVKNANEIIEQYYLHETNGTLTEIEAAMIKLSILEHYHLNDLIGNSDEDLVSEAILKFRKMFKDQIRPNISFAARANMGL